MYTGTVSGKHWIGMNDQDTEGTWIWKDSDSSVAWDNWVGGTGVPTDGSHLKNCGQLDASTADLNWNDEDCSAKLPMICERAIPCEGDTVGCLNKY